MHRTPGGSRRAPRGAHGNPWTAHTLRQMPTGNVARSRLDRDWQRCLIYGDFMKTTSNPAAYFGRQVRKERTEQRKGWFHEFREESKGFVMGRSQRTLLQSLR